MTAYNQNNKFGKPAHMRGDKKETPVAFNFMLGSDAKNLSGHAHILDLNGNIATVKVTSVKTWKTRPTIEVHYKYGLYETGQ